MSRVPYQDWLPEAHLRMITSPHALDAEPIINGTHVVDDYDNSAEVEELAYRLSQQQPYDSIIALSEYDILRAASLRDALGLPGQTYLSALAFRDKVIMKDHWAAAGLPFTPYAALDTATDLLAFEARHGFPIVVKPRRSSGSRAVTVLHDRDEISRWLRKSWSLPLSGISGWMAEKFVDGELLHVDGLARSGGLEIAWPSTLTSQLAFHERIPTISVLLDANDPEVSGMRELIAAAMRALPTPALTIFHAEIWRKSDGGLLLNEIASRLGGGKIRTTIAAAFGTDMAQRFVRGTMMPGYLKDDPPVTSPRRSAGFAVVPPQRGTVRSTLPVPGTFRGAGFIEAAITTRPGAVFTESSSSAAENVASCVATGSNRAAVMDLLAAFVEWSHGAITYTS